MPRLGSLVLASVLLGVPRALQARTFGAPGSPPRAVYVEISRPLPQLSAFAEAVSEALAASAWSLAAHRAEATTIIEVVSVVSGTDGRGRPLEAITLSLREGRQLRRMVLHGRPGDRPASAQALIARLSRRFS